MQTSFTCVCVCACVCVRVCVCVCVRVNHPPAITQRWLHLLRAHDSLSALQVHRTGQHVTQQQRNAQRRLVTNTGARSTRTKQTRHWLHRFSCEAGFTHTHARAHTHIHTYTHTHTHTQTHTHTNTWAWQRLQHRLVMSISTPRTWKQRNQEQHDATRKMG